MTAQLPSPRYHALDSLRAAMMLLGIYLHGAAAYTPGRDWSFKDLHTSWIFDGSLTFLHVFRMPVFFVMSGFFAALLLERRGSFPFAANRARRVLLPFIVGWVLIYPVVVWLWQFGRHLGQAGAAQAATRYILSGEIIQHRSTLHLWFLEYLVLFYSLALAARAALRFTPAVGDAIETRFRAVMSTRWRPLIFAAPSFGAMMLMYDAGQFDGAMAFRPAPRLLLAFGIPFAFGWLLYRNRHLLETVQRGAWTQAGAALACGVVNVYFYAYLAPLGAHAPAALRCAAAAAHALTQWLAIFALTGLFLRYMNRPAPIVRYASDSSYFMYLGHYPVMLAIQVAIGRQDWPPPAKLAFVLAGTVGILLLAYNYAVRPTAVGEFLNGRRYAPGLPEMDRQATSDKRLAASTPS